MEGDCEMMLITASFGHDAAHKVWLSFRSLEIHQFINVAMNFGCDIHFAVDRHQWSL